MTLILLRVLIQEEKFGTSLKLVSLKQPKRHGIFQHCIKAKRAGEYLLKV